MDHSFVAIDFETACYSKLSPCSLGVAVYDHGSLTESRHWLLKPSDPGKFSFSHLHGITWEDVKNQASIKDIWYELKGMLHNRFIVAHNAAFDLSILKMNLNHLGLEYPNYYHGCTMNLAKQNFSYLKDYKLSSICELMSIDYGNHDAEADAVSCAHIFGKMLKMHKYPEELFRGSQLSDESFLPKTAPSKNFFSDGKSANMTDIVIDDVDGSATSEFFTDKCCVVTGLFSKWSRQEVEDFIVQKGGKIQSSVNSKTNQVIIGNEPGWSKIEKVKILLESGQKITVMDESEFIQVIEKIESLKSS